MTDLTTEELNIIYQIRLALDAMHMDLHELPEECRRLKAKVMDLVLERDGYRVQAEQKWRLRRELEELLGSTEGMDSDEALRVAVEKIKALKEGK